MLSGADPTAKSAHPFTSAQFTLEPSGGQAMILREILQTKGTLVHTIERDDSLQEVVDRLVRHNCGSLVVVDSRSSEVTMVGIVTERDILRACATHRCPLNALTVADAMTTDVVTGTPCDSIEDTMGLMTIRRIRHLPVVDDGALVGLISIGDIVKTQHDRLTMENHYLKSYLHSS
jgi:CBS domain-containing protein